MLSGSGVVIVLQRTSSLITASVPGNKAKSITPNTREPVQNTYGTI